MCKFCNDSREIHEITRKMNGLSKRAREIHENISHGRNSHDDSDFKCDQWKEKFDSGDESDCSEHESSCKKDLKDKFEKGHKDHSHSSNAEVCKKGGNNNSQKNRNTQKDEKLIKGSGSHSSKNAEKGERKKRKMHVIKHYEKRYVIDDEKDQKEDQDCDNHKGHDHVRNFAECESESDSCSEKVFRSKESDSESDSCSEKNGNLIKEVRGKKSGNAVHKSHHKRKDDHGKKKQSSSHHDDSCSESENHKHESKDRRSKRHHRHHPRPTPCSDSSSSSSCSSSSSSSSSTCASSISCKRGVCRRRSSRR